MKSDERKINKIVKRNLTVISTEIAAQTKNENNVETYPTVIRRILKNAGYNLRQGRKKSLINKINKTKNIKVCGNVLIWDKILFLNETKYNIFESLIFEFKIELTMPTVKQGSDDILVWGCMSSFELG